MQRRTVQVLLFFTIVFTLYTILNSYIFIRGLGVVPPKFHIWYIIGFVLLAYSYWWGRLLERVSLAWPTRVLVFVGAYWLSAMVYLYMMLLGIDVLRLLNHLVPVFPQFISANSGLAAQVTALIIVGVVVIVVVAGHFNARRPRIKTLDLSIPKNSRPLKSLNLVVASDIHLGTIVSKKRLERIVQAINALDPDLVLLPGDVVDEDLGPVIHQNIGETLRTIKSKYGVLACTGNHEYIGGVEDAFQYLTDHGIRVLRDSFTKVADSVFVIGREDRAMRQFAGKVRKPLNEIMAGIDRNYPLILMDHQPAHLEEAVQQGVDLQLSGHTHHGQLWPFSFFTKKMFEVSWGYKLKERTHVYVSSGIGTWGPPVRTGNRPEIVQIKLSFH